MNKQLKIFCVNTQRTVVIYYRRFGTTYQSLSQGSRILQTLQNCVFRIVICSSELSFVLCLSLCYATVFILFCCYYVVLLLCCSVIICVILCIDRVYCTTATGC